MVKEILDLISIIKNYFRSGSVLKKSKLKIIVFLNIYQIHVFIIVVYQRSVKIYLKRFHLYFLIVKCIQSVNSFINRETIIFLEIVETI